MILFLGAELVDILGPHRVPEKALIVRKRSLRQKLARQETDDSETRMSVRYVFLVYWLPM